MKKLLAALAFLLMPLASDAAPGGPSTVLVIDTLAHMTGLTATVLATNPDIQLLGYTTAGDGGGGPFHYFSGSSATANICTTFAPSAGAGRIIRQPSSVLDVRQCGAAVDGATNDYAALKAAVALGGRISIPCGTLILASASMTTTNAIPGVSNTDIEAPSPFCTTIQITGTTEVYQVFSWLNASNVTIKNIVFYGNNKSTTTNATGILFFKMDATPSASTGGFVLENIGLENIQQGYWAQFDNFGTHSIKNILVRNLYCKSFTGNNQGTSNVGISSDCIAFQGVENDVGGLVEDVTVEYGLCDCDYMKRYADMWSGVKNGRYLYNTIINAGQDTNADDGGYALLQYENTTSYGVLAPNGLMDIGNRIINPHSMGIYATTVNDVTISGNYCSGQSDTTSATLLYSCLAVVRSTGVIAITNNTIEGSYRGIGVTTLSNAAYTISDNVISGSVSSATGFDVESSAAVNSNAPVVMDGNTVALTGSGSIAAYLITATGSSSSFDTVSITGGSYAAGAYDIRSRDTGGGGAVANAIKVTGVHLAGTPSVDGLVHTAVATPLYLSAVSIDASNFGSGADAFELTSATKVYAEDLKVYNFTPTVGYGWDAIGTQGTLAPGGLQVFGAPSGHIFHATSMGGQAPTWSATQGNFVQNIAPSGASHLHGWTNTSSGSGTTWTED